MKHLFRFLGRKHNDATWQIDPVDQAHIMRVLKLRPGDKIEAGNGQGAWAEGTLAEEGGEITLKVEREFNAVPPKPVILLLGALKHGDFDDLIAPLTEVGVTACYLFLQPGSEKSRLADKAQKRWQNLKLAALKQAKCPYFLEIATFKSLADAVAKVPPELKQSRYCLGVDAPSFLSAVSPQGSPGVAFAVGSEHGFSEQEWSLLIGEGFRPASIGPHVLRAKTAAVLAGGLGALGLLNSN